MSGAAPDDPAAADRRAAPDGPTTGPAAPARSAGLVDPRVVELLDPVTAVLGGAFAYRDAPRELPDEQAEPSLRVRRDVRGPGLRIVVDRYEDDQRVDGEALTVDRLPLDRHLARPRPRRLPLPASRLHVVAADGTGPDDTPAVASRGHAPASAVGAGAAGAAGEGHHLDVEVVGGGPDRRLTVPAGGPGPEDIRAVLAEAPRHRAVVLDALATTDPALVAALALQVVAAGTVCWCPPATAERLELLGGELRGALAFDAADLDDELALVARAAIQKRAAWAAHDLRLAWAPDDQGAWRPRLSHVPWPAVSIVLVSRRPDLVPMALAMIAEQQHVELEVVVALHGSVDTGPVEEERRRLGLAGQVLSVPAQVPFGAVCNLAVERTSGSVVLKWDDDDLYGPRHVEDLLVARRQTGAAMIGKAAEFVYLEDSAQTIWRNPDRAEGPSTAQAGGTFLLDRALLDEVGGFPPVRRAIDHHLKIRLRDRGTTPFRTHGFGFVLRRHAQGHTWDAPDDRFRGRAVRTFDGLPEVLQLGDAARFSRLPDR